MAHIILLHSPRTMKYLSALLEREHCGISKAINQSGMNDECDMPQSRHMTNEIRNTIRVAREGGGVHSHETVGAENFQWTGNRVVCF